MISGATRKGGLVVVVGPSGAGKDSVMGAARALLGERDDVVFLRRCITRPADAGGEAHHAVDTATFRQMQAAGTFAVAWHAHGLDYGVPRAALDDVAAGRTVIVNGSRHAIDDFRSAFGMIHGVLITAAPEILARRLAARGRESEEEIAARLARRPREQQAMGPGFTLIDNSGAIEIAAQRFAGLIEDIASGHSRLATGRALGGDL
ncbi:phosphonate metabolism protein/1,5-bisphosphokinase (PRPP-forming) PhnN [Rhizobium sp. SG2393]|uniref:phosphonate metabolism protein/1,5-bisphosphokinase (PRPP-forming) PhnN n=1 Tax=Rhizobium sp. SG2393 TaxID=3276279 RepID=UPI00366C0DD7